MPTTINFQNHTNNELVLSVYRANNPFVPAEGMLVEHEGQDYKVLKVKVRYIYLGDPEDEYGVVITVLVKKDRDLS